MSHINQSSPAQRQQSHQHSSMKRSISQIHSRCEEPTTGSFRVRTKGAQDNVERNKRGRRGGARRICPRECRQRRGRGRRSECRIDLHLKGTTKEVNEVRGEDEGDDYQGGVDNDKDSKSKRIQVGSWLGRMHKWAV